MRYIAAYLLLQAGGNGSPTAADIEELLETVNIKTDCERLEKLLCELEGKSTAELICEGSQKLSSVPSGGGGGGGSAAAAVAGESAPAVVEEKKEEKVEEKEESDDDMGFGLFD